MLLGPHSLFLIPALFLARRKLFYSGIMPLRGHWLPCCAGPGRIPAEPGTAMSRCPAPDLLERFLAQRLEPLDQAAAADHVRDCPDCRSACARLSTVTAPAPNEPVTIPVSPIASADAPTARLWRHELALRSGERPVQASPEFNVLFPAWPPAQRPLTVPGYELLGELGRGGMGIVFKAKQVRLNRLVALKMIHAGELSDPNTLARFRSEAEAVARLHHPNIVQIYEVGEVDNQPFFSLEYVGGGSLVQRAAGQPQPPVAAAALVEVLARAIHYAHSQGVVHRDLKPGNVLIADSEAEPTKADPSVSLLQSAIRNPQSAIKIADFGLAKYTPAVAAGRTDGPTRPGLIIGTPQYMAPEQAGTTPEQVGPVADVYSLGAVLYELLTGRPPFQGAERHGHAPSGPTSGRDSAPSLATEDAARPGDDRAQVLAEGTKAAVRIGSGVGRRPAAVPGWGSDPAPGRRRCRSGHGKGPGATRVRQPSACWR